MRQLYFGSTLDKSNSNKITLQILLQQITE